MKDENGYDPEDDHYQDWAREQIEFAREESGWTEEEEEEDG